MKVFLRSSVVFTAFACTFYVLGILALGLTGVTALNLNFAYHLSPSQSALRLRDLHEVDSLDVLILGSSRAYTGFDTRLFNAAGYSAFVLGTDAQTPVQTLMLLQRYLDEIAPRMAIYEINMEGLERDGVESAIDLISSDVTDEHTWHMVKTINKPMTYHAFLFAMARQAAGSSIEYEGDLGGYLRGSGYVAGTMMSNQDWHMVFPLREIDVKDFQWDAFLAVLRLLKENNISVMLVQAPIPSEKYLAMTNRTSVQLQMQRMATFYAFNDIVALDDSLHFMDSYHLNQNGAEIFTDKVIGLLASEHPSLAE
jgi:hypothetical protein